MTDPLRMTVRRADIEAKPSNADDVLPGRRLPASGPADPMQHVGNGLRSPEKYKDLRVTPNLTGFYFDDKGRYRLLINQAGPHLEALLTLVTLDHRYHEVAKSLAKDKRIPIDWGVCDGELKGGKYQPLAFRIAGDHVYGGTYSLYVPSWIGAYDRKKYQELFFVGEIEVTGDDTVQLTLSHGFRKRWPEHRGAAESTATRVDRSPVLLDRYMTHASVPWAVRTRVWFPSTPIQRRAMPSMAWRVLTHMVAVDEHMRPTKGGTEKTLHELLLEARPLGTETLENIRRNNIADSVNVLIKDVFEHPGSTLVTAGGFGASHSEELRKLVYRVLNGAYLMAADGYPRENMATVLQRMLDRAQGEATDLRAIEKYLGVGARGATVHRLRVKFTALDLTDLNAMLEQLGAEARKQIEKALEESSERFKKLKKLTKYLPVSTYIGLLEVEYESPADQFPRMPGWKAKYGILLGGAAYSRKVGTKPKIEIEGIGLCYSASPPTPRHQEGTAGYFRGDAFVGVRADDFFGLDLQLGGGKAGLLLYGDGTPGAGMHLLLDGEIGDVSAGGGAGFDSTLGQVWLMSADGGGDIEWIADAVEPVEFSTYWAEHIGELAVFFPINGARLPVPTPKEEDLMSEHGMLTVRQALEAFAACELPLLVNPMASIRLEGHADRPDTRKNNSTLSQYRATSVDNYLQSILGTDLASRTHLIARGEPGEGEESVFDPSYRRVDIIVRVEAPGATSPKAEALESTRFQLRQPSPRGK